MNRNGEVLILGLLRFSAVIGRRETGKICRGAWHQWCFKRKVSERQGNHSKLLFNYMKLTWKTIYSSKQYFCIILYTHFKHIFLKWNRNHCWNLPWFLRTSWHTVWEPFFFLINKTVFVKRKPLYILRRNSIVIHVHLYRRIYPPLVREIISQVLFCKSAVEHVAGFFSSVTSNHGDR